MLKRIVHVLPEGWLLSLKRHVYAHKIRSNRFRSDEPEHRLLSDFVSPGAWVIDVGANVGHYSLRMSDLVGPTGRVIAFEPIRETFSLLSANVQLFPHANVTLLNMGASDQEDVARMDVPMWNIVSPLTRIGPHSPPRLLLPQPTAFTALVRGFEGVCPCCRKPR